MQGQKAIVKFAKLYRDNYAVARIDPKDKSKIDGQVVGWVLTNSDPETWKEKLAHYDRIEGY